MQPAKSSAESEWLDHYSDNPKMCWCIMCQCEQKRRSEWSVPGSWSCAGWCPPLAETLHGTDVFVPARVCVRVRVSVCGCVCDGGKREASAVEEMGRVHSAVWKIGGRVLSVC